MDVEFFVAPNDRSAAAVREIGPSRAFESLAYECFYPDDAVLDWESRLTGVSVTDLRGLGEPRVVAGMRNDGCEVFAVSERLRAALAAAEPDLLREIAERWGDLEAQDGDPDSVTRETAVEVLEGVATLARKVEAGDQQLYCWWR